MPAFRVIAANRGDVYKGQSSHDAYSMMNDCINRRLHVSMTKDGKKIEEWKPTPRPLALKTVLVNPLRIQIEACLRSLGNLITVNDRWVDALIASMETWPHGHVFTNGTGEITDQFTINAKWDRKAGDVTLTLYQEYMN